MVMSWIFTVMGLISIAAAIICGNGAALAASIPQGAQNGITLALSISGSVCLWSGFGKLMEQCGITDFLSKMLRPFLHTVFPDTKANPRLAGALSSNICANLLGLGNAATPMGIKAAQLMANGSVATDHLCRLIVLNTASIQLIPYTVASLRAAYGSSAPFDIIPAVLITSLCSASAGLLAAWLLGKVWRK